MEEQKRCNEARNTVKLFEKYKCKGFYKKIYDGVFIDLDRENLKATWMNTHLWNISDSIVAEDVEVAEKKYYEHVQRNFTGVVVGFVDLVVDGYLDVNYEDAIDTGCGMIPEKFYVSKRAKKIVRCAIVYYASGKKHYVPIDDISEIL